MLHVTVLTSFTHVCRPEGSDVASSEQALSDPAPSEVPFSDLAHFVEGDEVPVAREESGGDRGR